MGQNKEWMPFEEARAFVRKLNFKNNSDWLEYCDIGDKPDNIPRSPASVYRDNGWCGLSDWLGTGIVQTQKREYLSFKKARKFVHKLQIKHHRDWPKYCTSGQKPANIPSTPAIVYKDKGWAGYADWLGRVKRTDIEYLPYEQARAIVHKQRLSNPSRWSKWCKSGKKPANIPANPKSYYKDRLWWDWRDWLGPL